jgi:hypothetical protein
LPVVLLEIQLSVVEMRPYSLALAIVFAALVSFFSLPWWLPRSWYRALLYPSGRPNWLSSRLNSGWARLCSLGILPALMVSLETKGYRTGKPYQIPMVSTQVGSERYLVSMLGENANWVRNVRAAKGEAVLRHRVADRVILEEVEAGKRAPILRAYLKRAPGARPHFDLNWRASLREFEDVASRYPVFRIVPR